MEVSRKRKRQRVLVVDDERHCRELLSRVLTEMGCDVIGASGGYEALLEIIKTPFDLVLTDLNMTGMDGWNLAQNIRKLNRAVRIVLVTGAEKTAIMKKIRNSSIDEVIFKPFSLDDIEEIIKKRFPARKGTATVLPYIKGTEGQP
jgi:CheY-like chemotaxis protein